MMPRWLRDTRVIVGVAVLLTLLALALLAPLLVQAAPDEQDLLATLLPSAWAQGGEAAHPLGTDSLGRDVLARVLYGARLALLVAAIAAPGAMVLGTIAALLAGYFGGWVDWVIGRAVDVWMSFPPVILSLILMVGLGTGSRNVILAIVLVDWTRFCRVLRAEVLVVVRRDYVTAARLVGFSHARVVLREVLPALMPLLVTLLTLEMGIAVVVEAILAFVGLGVKPDEIAWGQMIADGRATIYQAPMNLLAPVAAIFITVAGFNLLGDGLRRSLDLRLVEGRG
jgi:peptide/nickel transport system permease protein